MTSPAPTTAPTTEAAPTDARQRSVDVLIIGAGLSGIGAAARLTRDRPGTTLAVLEMRDGIGGTWDLFRFPGVRSDTDMFTFSYPFRPWHGETSMGSGEDIRRYITETATEFGIDRHIHFRTKVSAADWSSEQQRWTVRAETDGSPVTWTARFLFVCAGYYDYDRGYQPDFPGLADFRGTFIHPQFWPEDLDYTAKRVLVIGSGATAVTLIPALTENALHVTMLQRSPTYVMALPGVDVVADVLRRFLPAGLAHRLLRVKNVLKFQVIYSVSRRAPALARKIIRGVAVGRLQDEAYVDEHFRPLYNPWEQRLTLAPDGDFYDVIAQKKASVVTGKLDRFVAEGVRLADGTTVEADIIVSATGLSMRALGGMALSIDGRHVDVGSAVTYRAAMISGVPNLAFVFGYTNSSWTLRSDLSARLVVRLLRYMDKFGYDAATPEPDEDETDLRPFIDDLSSGYIQRGIAQFPRQGRRKPWQVRQNYLLDLVEALPGNVSRRMRFTRRSRSAVPTPTTVGAPHQAA
jgi:cation diffusion facilitator CzcD-associated flavoprotein CzcO